MSFFRPKDLIKHFKDIHADLLGRVIHLPSDLLLPSWRPFYPVPHPLPPLPSTVSPGCIVLGEVRGGNVRRRTPILQPSSQPSPSPARRKLLHNNTVESIESETFSFPDLPGREASMDLLQEALVFCRPTYLQGDNARPPPMFEPSRCLISMPKTILYDVFAQRVARGELQSDASG